MTKTNQQFSSKDIQYRESQQKKLFDAMLTGRKFTSASASDELQVYHLSQTAGAMIRKKGIPIIKKQMAGNNTSYKLYYLERDYIHAIKFGLIPHPFTPASADGNKNDG